MKSKENIKSDTIKNPKEYLEKITSEQKIKPFNYLSFFDKLSIEYVKEKYKDMFKKKKMFLVEMYLPNEKSELFTISTSKNYFIHDGGAYLIDNDFTKYDTLTKMSKLVYHKECAIPFKIEFNIDTLKETLQKQEENYELTVNPRTLKGFIISEVIEKVLKGGELTKDMDFIKKLVVIGLILQVITALIILKQSGMI